MEFCKALFAAIFIVALTAPLSSGLSDAEIVIRGVLMPTLANATKEMLNVYQFIASNWDLKETTLALGVANTPICSSNLQKKDNLSIAFIQLYNYKSPLRMAYSYEKAQGPQHKVLACAVWNTGLYLNATVSRVYREIWKTGSKGPTVQHVSEATLDHHSRQYLQAMVKNKLVNLTITDDIVKIYRNYVIFYTLRDVINDVVKCIR